MQRGRLTPRSLVVDLLTLVIRPSSSPKSFQFTFTSLLSLNKDDCPCKCISRRRYLTHTFQIPDIREYLQRLEGIVRDKGDDVCEAS